MKTKRIIAVALLVLMIMSAIVPAFAATWTCPHCGKKCEWVWCYTQWVNDWYVTINGTRYMRQSRGCRKEYTKCPYYDAWSEQYRYLLPGDPRIDY